MMEEFVLHCSLSNFVHRWAISSFTKRIKINPKAAWLSLSDLFKFLVPPTISPEWLKLETSNFVHRLAR